MYSPVPVEIFTLLFGWKASIKNVLEFKDLKYPQSFSVMPAILIFDFRIFR